MFFKKSDSVFAVDLGTDVLRAVQVKRRKEGPELAAFVSQPVAPGTPDTLVDRQLGALGELLRAHHVGTREMLATMPTSLVVTRTVQIDAQKKESPEDQIQAALQNCLPFDSRDLLFDYWKLRQVTAGPRSEVVVVATQASLVQRYLDGFEKLGVTCVHLDVAPCALASLIPHTQTTPDAVVGSIALSRDVGFFTITERDQVLFWRPFDLNAGASQKGVAVAGIQANLERVGDEISKCVSHMVGTMHLDNLAELLLFGHGSDDLVVNEYLKNRFNVPVRNPSPFGIFGVAQHTDDKQATHFGTATGLALQQFAGVGANG